MSTSNVLITGGAGFIGSHLADAVLAAGDNVRIVDDLSTGSLRNIRHLRDDIEFHESDFVDPAAADAACAGIDTVYHLGALGSVPRSIADPMSTHRVNASGTLQMLLSSRDSSVSRFVFSSSSSVFGSNQELPKREEMTGHPLSPYAATKRIAEDYLRQFASFYDFDAVAVRFFNVFGPRQAADHAYAAVIPKFLDATLTDTAVTVHGDGCQRRDFTYVDNVTSGLMGIGSADAALTKGEVYHLACGSSTSLLDVLDRIEQLRDQPVERVHTETRPGDIRDSMADISKLRKATGYSVDVDVDEGIRRTLEWFQSDFALSE